MNVFKKISLKYFNGSSNLNEGEERDIITSRDKAFIYACRKYNIDFEIIISSVELILSKNQTLNLNILL